MKAGVKRKLDSNEDRNDLAPATTETTETLFENTPLDFLNNGLKCGNGSKLAKLTTFTTLQRKLYARLFLVDPEDRSRPSLRESTQTQVGQSTQEETAAVNPVYINPEAPPDQRVEIDSIMAARLKEHQVEGVRFMWKQVVSRRSGCILAHSMGLGKTYQIITFVATLLREISNQNPNLPEYLKSKRILIVSPVIVLTNWVNEFSKWVPPGLESILGHVYNYADISNTYSKSKRLNYLQNWYYYGGILLMGYEAFRILDDWKDQVLHERVCQYLFDPGPALVIADEGHRIKSSSAKVTLSLRKIKTPARICLTGYPLQNNLQEYHCMINFVCQDFLPSEDVFKAQYRLPIEKDYQETARSDKIIAKKLLLTLQLLTSDIIQRRTQAVLQKELSPKTEYYIACSLSRTQYKIYLNVLQDLAEHDFDNIFYAVPILRSVCNHPAAFQSIIERTFAAYRIAKDTSDGAYITDINDFEDESAWQVFVSAIQTRLDKGMFSWTKEFFSALADRKDHHHSSKVEIASDIVKTSMQIGDKVVIVTHNIATLDYLQQMLPKVNNASVMRIDGQTPPQERQDIIDTFNREKDQHVMLLSARAGSLGVNITSANRIILMDADWNPSHEEQSLGRVYRYGQTKPVFAYRLYTASTIEDYLFKQGLQKRRLASRLIDNTQMPAQEKTGTKVALRYPRKKFPTLEQSVIDQIQDIVLQRVATEQRSAFVEISLADDVEYQVDINDPDLTEDDVRLIRSNVAAHKKKYYRRLRDSRSARM